MFKKKKARYIIGVRYYDTVVTKSEDIMDGDNKIGEKTIETQDMIKRYLVPVELSKKEADNSTIDQMTQFLAKQAIESIKPTIRVFVAEKMQVDFISRI